MVIGEHVEVKNSTVGPYVSIQNDTKLSKTVIKNSIIMSGNEIHAVTQPIVDSMIGRNTKIWKDDQSSLSLIIGDNCTVRLP